VAISFDGPNKIATLSSGTVTLSVTDIWSRWVDWLLSSDNSKYLPMFTIIGGDYVSPGVTIPFYAFLVNGWRIRPQEAHHTLEVSSGILLVDGGGDPFLNTIGNYVVRVNYSQPVQAITVATGGGGPPAPTVAEIVAGVRIELAVELAKIGELALLEGLVIGSPLVINENTNTRAAGPIGQTVITSGNITTVTRV
jgi:hypothetical protein